MTDLTKTYKTETAAKAAMTRKGQSGSIVVQGGVAAIVARPTSRQSAIQAPNPGTARAYIWDRCDALLAMGLSYKMLRREVLYQGVDDGYNLPQMQSEISRWRHRFG
jgi:hypothetical protein